MNTAISKQFLKAFLLTAIVGSIVNLLVDAFQASSFTIFILSDIFTCLAPIIGYVILKIYRNENLVITFMAIIIIPAMVYQFLITGGFLNGINITVIIVIGYMCSLTLKSNFRFYMHVFILSILLGLLIYQCLFIDSFNIIPNKSVGRVIGYAIPYIAIYLILAVSAGVLKDKYDQSNSKLTLRNSEINKRNKKIAKQNEILQLQQDELNKLNDYLEIQVKIRTENIRTKNEQLSVYSFKNAHNVRGSLARILGLISLNEMGSKVSREELLNLIATEAKEMDITLKQISDDLFQELDK